MIFTSSDELFKKSLSFTIFTYSLHICLLYIVLQFWLVLSSVGHELTKIEGCFLYFTINLQIDSFPEIFFLKISNNKFSCM